MTELAVHRLRLSHFRSYRAATLDTGGRPVVLFGRNGAGKTNILEALSLLSPGRGLRRAPGAEMARRPEALGWRVDATAATPDGEHEVSLRAEAAGPRAVTLDGRAVSQTALGRRLRLLWLVPAMDRLWTEGAEGRRRFLDRMTLSFEPGHADAALDYEKAMRERNRLLKDQVADPAWYLALEAQMARTGAQLMRNRQDALRRLDAAMAETESAFPAAVLGLEAAEGRAVPATEEEMRAHWARFRGLDLRAGRTLMGPHRSDLLARYAAKDMEARLCSTGEQKALLISLVLANGRALGKDYGAPPILLLDEVSAHLDAGRRAALYDEICAMGAQAWMTGTDAELFVALGERALWFEVSEREGASHLEERKS